MSKKEPFIINRIKSIGFAFKGALLLLKNEASIQIQASITILVTLAGFYFEISAIEWMIQLLVIAIVLSAEALNSAIEEIADFIHPEHHNRIGYIKDVAAGAVFFAGIAAIIIAGIIYIPKF
ncbi:MAG: diacylglycerol kinase (ATP) [Flavobacteriaceae bacterium]|jgi:diacylglycerol kinase (ATP)